MGLSSLQVCMDTSDWLQGVNRDENGADSSSPSGDMMTCSRPLERRLRPPNDQALKCPRCDSAHTKFCYYNNYSLSQPRYFCKTCRRYWTKGGSLRNIPVGGGCRKNKRVTAKKQNEKPLNSYQSSSSTHDPTGSFSEVQFSHLVNLLESSGGFESTSFMERGCNAMLENSSRQVDFKANKFDGILGNTSNHDFMGTNDLGFVGSLGEVDTIHGFRHNFHGLCSSFGNNGTLVETNQRLMLPYERIEDPNANEMKPNKFFSLDWQDHGCSEDGKDSIGYIDGTGSYALMSGYGSSAINPLQ